MKINIRYCYIGALLVLLLSDPLFSEIFTGKAPEGDLSPHPSHEFNLLYARFFAIMCVALSVLYYRYLRGMALGVFWASVAATGLLAAESYWFYDTPMVYPHVFQKLLVLFAIPAFYGLYARVGRITLADIIPMIWVVLALNLALVNLESLSVGAFLAHNRGLYASSVYLLMLPLLYHFNVYLEQRQTRQLLLFFLAAFAIFFFQHRTVWVTSAVALALNALLIARAAPKRLGGAAVPMLIGIPLLVVSLAASFILVSYPEVTEKLAANFSDIENHSTQGTGEWRAIQFDSYWPFVEDHPVLGMRLAGFELPVQFYNPESNTPFFEDGHGHNLHSFYLETLFYFGAVGLLLFVLPHLYVARHLLRRVPASPEALTWAILIVTNLVYAYSYCLPPFFYGFIGFGLLRITQLTATPQTAKAPLPPPARPQPAPFPAESNSLPFPV
ncbi:O-antigen ligase family protein [Hymenobacter sediminicola]|uniref:O-antigen ligase family protein n=1 Tax=Hymenobacter sediminicola TaxID=2761579 RepID=A0A7G7W416_9BACT|nr:O-antigen ligase family protein [Hymenobacter sediminicola]QNH61109.1 O-antigen ligase family protein [Hymenobacter sediminicola]